MSQDTVPQPPSSDAPDAAQIASSRDFEPSDAMRKRNRRVGMIFLAAIAFLIALTVITRIIQSS